MPRIDVAGLQLSPPSIRSLHDLSETAAEYAGLVTRTLADGASLTRRDSAPTKDCSHDSNSAICQKPTDSGNSGTLTIVLGAVIPISCALVVLFYLHRRLVRKRRQEDANDKYKSLDFGDGGLAPTAGPSRGFHNGQRIPEMAITDLGGDDFKPNRKIRGMSMDMGSPFLLPAGLNGSHESIHSMSRISDGQDPYRPVQMIKDSSSVRSFPRKALDGASVYSASTGFGSTHERSGFAPNAQLMSKSNPRRSDSIPSPHDSKHSDVPPPLPSKAFVPPPKQAQVNATEIPLRDLTMSSPMQDRFSDPPLSPEAAFQAHSPPPPPPPPRTTSISSPHPPRKSSVAASSAYTRRSSYYADDDYPVPVPQQSWNHKDYPHNVGPQNDYTNPPAINEQYTDPYADPYSEPYHGTNTEYSNNLGLPMQSNNRYSIMGVRPLPPDNPDESAEQRANRIRSFYKEYFDVNKAGPGGYEEDYDADFLADGAVYDPDTGAFVTGGGRPWNQNVGRRAMTPPPRGARQHFSAASGVQGPHRRNLSTGMRGRIASPQQRRKQLPPPRPLQSLGTPHLLKDDSALFNAADFAPPTSFRDLQNGRRPESPLGGSRPYSPLMHPYSPLQSSFSDLRPMPSPHELRKSSTFTALDFAPPRFGNQDNMSDAGSIRSARSGISAVQRDAVRAGAYRVSRIPKAVVSSREDLSSQLKPTWGMRDNSTFQY